MDAPKPPKKCLGLMKFLPSDAEVLSKVETPKRPAPPRDRNTAAYGETYYHYILDASKKP